MANSLVLLQQQLIKQGQRRLLLLSGQATWVSQQLAAITSDLAGDWVTISPEINSAIAPAKATSLLGQEFLQGIFDAQSGFHAESFAILAGTLKAGSFLILAVPPWDQWGSLPDSDSLRWNENHGVIATPHFVEHLKRTLLADADIFLRREGYADTFPLIKPAPCWQPPTGQPTAAQQQILSQLLNAQSGVWGVIAPRGRGKSALAGMLIDQWSGTCWHCAPARITTSVLNRFTDKEPVFWAVDQLLAYCQSGGEISADWLVIDEAAAIPTSQLKQLLSYFPRCLLTTTVDGYEGTGRGFLLKFCAELDNFTALSLDTPIRWAQNDPLERWLNKALLLDEVATEIVDNQQVMRFQAITQDQFSRDPQQLAAFYRLLTSAHYRTSPLDLRRLFDAQNMNFMALKFGSQLIGALWMVNEGQLSPLLAWQVWAGIRRPRGNLVAQSLAAHCYFPQAAQMRSQRCSRIAIQAEFRRQGAGLELIKQEITRAKSEQYDFLSVSFGFTAELYSFWQRAGFSLIRIGSQKEASSGCYAAMMILALSPAAEVFSLRAQKLFHRDLYWREDRAELALLVNEDQQMVEEDWQELAGFAYASRSLASSYPAICRFLRHYDLPLPLLRLYCEERLSVAEACHQLGLSGQKQWLRQARAEMQLALASQAPQQAADWSVRIKAFYL